MLQNRKSDRRVDPSAIGLERKDLRVNKKLKLDWSIFPFTPPSSALGSLRETLIIK
jgi:hypothetical protein